ncbi:MAG: hypothetical protein QOE05_2217, partial [Actinomycetota bacterium]|nr:hypothetical protein [Actinomycetota bacterium]
GHGQACVTGAVRLYVLSVGKWDVGKDT